MKRHILAWLAWLRPLPVCPSCRLLRCEAIDINCRCDWARSRAP